MEHSLINYFILIVFFLSTCIFQVKQIIVTKIVNLILL